MVYNLFNIMNWRGLLVRHFEELVIDKAIVHILDKKGTDKVLSDFILEIDDDSEKLITTHIKKSINDDNTNIAKFKTDEGVLGVKDACQKIIESNDDELFITQSKIIANRLYSVMTRVTTSANFVVCKYKADDKSYVTLLKMDFNDITQSKRIEIDGKIKVVLEKKGVAMPNIKQKLHKCIFYKSFEETSDYDIIILDRQVDKEEKEVSDFFADRFLQCHVCGTDKINTRKFKKLTEEFLRDSFNRDEMYFKRRDLLLDTLITSDQILVDDFARTLFGDDEYNIERYKKKISDELGHLNIKVDPDYKRNNITKRKYETEEGITINLSNDLIDKIKFQKLESGLINITIENVRLRDVRDS